MAALKQNSISLFLVLSKPARLDGAEKALVKLTAALFPEVAFFFSSSILPQSLSTPSTKTGNKHSILVML